MDRFSKFSRKDRQNMTVAEVSQRNLRNEPVIPVQNENFFQRVLLLTEFAINNPRLAASIGLTTLLVAACAPEGIPQAELRDMQTKIAEQEAKLEALNTATPIPSETPLPTYTPSPTLNADQQARATLEAENGALRETLVAIQATSAAATNAAANSEALPVQPSPTESATSSPTASATAAETSTVTASPTATSTETATASATATNTETATQTATATATEAPSATPTAVAVETPSYIPQEQREQPFFSINNIHPLAEPQRWMAQIQAALDLAEQQGASPAAVIEFAHNDWFAYITVQELAEMVNNTTGLKTRYGMVNRNRNDLERLYSFIASDVWQKITENQLRQEVLTDIGENALNYGRRGFNLNLNESQADLFEIQPDGSAVTLVRAEEAEFTSDRLLQIGLGMFDQISSEMSFTSEDAKNEYRREFAIAYQRAARNFFGFTSQNYETITHVVEGIRVPFNRVVGDNTSAAVRYLEQYFTCRYEAAADPNGDTRSGQFNRDEELELIPVRIRDANGNEQSLTFTHDPHNRTYDILAGFDRAAVIAALGDEARHMSPSELVEFIMNFAGQENRQNPEGHGYVEIINSDSGAGLTEQSGMPYRDVPMSFVLGEIERTQPQVALAIQQQLAYYRQCREQGLVPTTAPVIMTTPDGYVFTITPEYVPSTTPGASVTPPRETPQYTPTPQKSENTQQEGDGGVGLNEEGEGPIQNDDPIDLPQPTNPPLPTTVPAQGGEDTEPGTEATPFQM